MKANVSSTMYYVIQELERLSELTAMSCDYVCVNKQ